MNIPIAKEGYPFIIPLIIGSAVSWVFFPIIITIILTGLLIFVTFFFRDPERIVSEEKNTVLSPADGKIVEIVVEEDPFLKRPFKRISIFLNVFNVHIN